MYKKNLIVAISLISIFACKSNKENAASKKTVESTSSVQVPTSTFPQTEGMSSVPVTKENTKQEELYRLSVVFYSIGSGTENNYMRAFEDYIGTYAGNVGKNIDYLKTPWGREGETDYCLLLNELSGDEQGNFIAGAKAVLDSAKWVHIYENQPCAHKPKR